MTLTLELSPERESALKAQAEARGLSIAEWLLQLAEEAAPAAEPPTPAGQAPVQRPIWEVILERMKALPPEVFERLPTDGASEHDHYLYGAPKRNQ